jgi:hypothetical protein
MNPHCRAPCLAQYSEAGYFYPVQFLWKGKTSAAGGAHCGVRLLRAPGGFPAAGRRSPSERRSLPAPPPAERHRRGRARPGRSTSRRAAPRAPAPAHWICRMNPGCSSQSSAALRKEARASAAPSGHSHSQAGSRRAGHCTRGESPACPDYCSPRTAAQAAIEFACNSFAWL